MTGERPGLRFGMDERALGAFLGDLNVGPLPHLGADRLHVSGDTTGPARGSAVGPARHLWCLNRPDGADCDSFTTLSHARAYASDLGYEVLVERLFDGFYPDDMLSDG